MQEEIASLASSPAAFISDPTAAEILHRMDVPVNEAAGVGELETDTIDKLSVRRSSAGDRRVEGLHRSGEEGDQECGSILRERTGEGWRDLTNSHEAEGVHGLRKLDSEPKTPVVHGDLRERGAGLVSDDDIESGGSTPKRRFGTFRTRANGLSCMENGVEGSFKEIPLKGALDLSPPERDAKEHRMESMDEEFAVGGEHLSAEIRPMTLTILKTLFYVLVWYLFSTLLTLYNKRLLGKKLGNFPAPLLMNTIHFSMQGIISTLLVRFWWKTPIRMTWRDYFSRVVPTAGATALDIDLSNISLVFISVTFSTMCKSGAPVFLLLFAFAFKLEVPSFKLLAIIVIISLGVMLTAVDEFHQSRLSEKVAKDTEFELWGFILVMLAAVMSGFRWTVTQILLQKEEYGLNNPFAAMAYLTPVMAGITLAFSFATEPWDKFGQTSYFDTSQHVFDSCALMLLGGTIAFFMVMTEYLLVLATSAVTLTVAGVIKEVVTIVVDVLYFNSPFEVWKGVGLVVIIFGVSLFNWFKYQKLVEGKLSNHHGATHQEGDRSSLKYMPLEDEIVVFKLEDESDQHNL